MRQSETEQSDARTLESFWTAMREEHLRLTLMLHGNFIRALTLFEVERDGLPRARARSKLFEERLRKYVGSIDPGNPRNPTEPR